MKVTDPAKLREIVDEAREEIEAWVAPSFGRMSGTGRSQRAVPDNALGRCVKVLRSAGR